MTVDRRTRKLVEVSPELEGVEGILHARRRRRQQRRGGFRISGRKQEFQRGPELVSTRVAVCRPAHRLRARRREQLEVVAYWPRQVPPAPAGGGERDARVECAREQAGIAADGADELGIEQRQAGDLGEPRLTRGAESDQSLIQDGSQRPGWVARAGCHPGHCLDPLSGASRPRCGEDGGRGPTIRRPVEGFRRARVDVEPEAGPTQTQRLLGAQREVAGGELQVLGAAQPASTLGQLPGQNDQPLLTLQSRGEVIDELPGIRQAVVGVVEHERATLAGQSRDDGIDDRRRFDLVLGGCCRVGEPGPNDRLVQASGQQSSGHAGVVQPHLDAHRLPVSDQLGGENALPVPARGLDDDDLMIPAASG